MIRILPLCLFVLSLTTISCAVVYAQTSPILIAHRGASAYLPEHTLEAKALAIGMGADFVEQDVALSKDDQPIVIHDIHLDRVTNVAEVFPARARADGRYYVLDFTLAEIRRLAVTERTTADSKKAVYPRRFPVGRSRFELHTLAEELEFVAGLNRSTGRQVGVYTEIKQPGWHRKEGHDISVIVLQTLQEYGYEERSSRAFVQCFELEEVKRLRTELKCQLRLVQLLGKSSVATVDGEYVVGSDRMSLSELAKYATGIGPDYQLLRTGGYGASGSWSPLVEQAHRAGLVVHPYTLRADQLPAGRKDFADLVRDIVRHGKVDGFFTDHPDLARQAIDRE